MQYNADVCSSSVILCLTSFFSFFGSDEIVDYTLYTPRLPAQEGDVVRLIPHRTDGSNAPNHMMEKKLCVLNPLKGNDVGSGAWNFVRMVQPRFKEASKRLRSGQHSLMSIAMESE